MTTRIVAGNDSAFTYVRLKYGANATDTVTGVIIYPDDFTFSEAGVGAMDFGAYPVTQIDAVTWEALEDVGCVFLPEANSLGYTGGQPSIYEAGFGQYSYYWSSSANNASNAYATAFNFFSKTVNPMISHKRNLGFTVRLVQDL